jgi:hypothetical protein
MIDYRAHNTMAPAAPGDLEVVQRFINLHEHRPGTTEQVPPSRRLLETFLRDRGLLDGSESFTEADRQSALALIDALHAMVDSNAGQPMTAERIAAVDDLGRRAGLHPSLGADGPAIVQSRAGAVGALGRLIAIAFLARLDGSWGHLRSCASEDCRAVFYDRSKNRSGRWCSMTRCGNRAKVRAWRERQRVDDES